MSALRACASLLLLARICGCAPPDAQGPQTVRVLAQLNPDTYRLTDVRLETLESARHVRGTVAVLRGDGSLILEEELLSDDLRSENRDDVKQATLVQGDRQVVADYVNDNKMLIPRDWESLLMFSFYHNAETALAFYRSLGVDDAVVQPFVAQFYVRITALVLWGSLLITDNAAYSPLDDCLLLFPQQTLTDGGP